MMKSGKAIFVALILLSVSGCVSAPELVSFDEVARVSSPDRRADAILVETNGGATTSFGYYVFVVPPGVKLKERDDKYIVVKLHATTRNKSAYGANLNWSDKERLKIEFLSARSAELLEPTINYGGFDVAVELVRGVEDPSSPQGGMLQ